MGASFVNSFPQAPQNIQSAFRNVGKGLWLVGKAPCLRVRRRLRLLYTRRVIEGPVHSCVWAEAEDPAHFPQAREPGRCAAGVASLISHGWAASVALPDFWTLCASIKILNYLSNLPFNKFVLKCLDWRKITDGTYNTNQKTTFWNSDFRGLVECGWGRLETQGSVYY